MYNLGFDNNRASPALWMMTAFRAQVVRLYLFLSVLRCNDDSNDEFSSVDVYIFYVTCMVWVLSVVLFSITVFCCCLSYSWYSQNTRNRLRRGIKYPIGCWGSGEWEVNTDSVMCVTVCTCLRVVVATLYNYRHAHRLKKEQKKFKYMLRKRCMSHKSNLLPRA